MRRSNKYKLSFSSTYTHRENWLNHTLLLEGESIWMYGQKLSISSPLLGAAIKVQREQGQKSVSPARTLPGSWERISGAL